MADSTAKTPDPLWYKDAVIYQVHIKAFKDSNNDGIGDFRGLIEKLDYLENLGVTAIWILPFYPSPLKDDGYDIADYYGIHSDYGMMDDFKEFIYEAHRRNLKVITELVLNHTSDQHAFFKRARFAPPGSIERDFYVWSDTADKYREARIIFRDYEISNWTYDPIAKAYYWHRFYSHQPDLNFDNPEVHKECFDVVDYWFNLGVDGLRLDAVPYLYEREGTNCENLPETHAFLKTLNEHVHSSFPNKMLLAEANQWPEDAVAYFGDGDECHMAFHFPLMPRIYMSIQMEDRFPITDIIEQTPQIPENCQWAIFLRNHDELTLEMVTDEERDYMYRYYAKDKRARINLGIRRRLAPLVENNRRKIELLNILLFSFPGTPIIYYGDEIGMGDNYYLGDRNGVRTPMQWSSDRNAGFSEANPQKLYLPVIIDPEYHYEAVNTDVQTRNPSSLLWWMKRAVALRKSHKEFSRGSIEFLTAANTKVLAFIRCYEGDAILVVANLSRYSQVVEIDLEKYVGYTPIEAFSRNKFPVVKSGSYMLTMNGYDYYWFIMSKEKREVMTDEAAERPIPELRVPHAWKDVFKGVDQELFEENVLPGYIKQLEWMEGKENEFQEVTISDVIPLTDGTSEEVMLVLRIHNFYKAHEYYLLPLAAATGEKAERVHKEYPKTVIARVFVRDEEYLLYDGVYDEHFRRVLFAALTHSVHVKTRSGEVVCMVDKRVRDLAGADASTVASTLLSTDDNLSQLIYGGAIAVKLYRRLEEGVNPGIEMLKTLGQRGTYTNIPPYVGEANYRHPGTEPVSLCLLKDYVANQGDAWTLVLDSIKNYFDNVITKNEAEEVAYIPGRTIFSPQETHDIDVETTELTKIIYAETIRLLGKRTGELHAAMSAMLYDPAFTPEHFSNLYQRSLYQSGRNLIKTTLREMRRNAALFENGNEAALKTVIAGENDMLAFVHTLLERRIDAMKIRVHGNYHLAQMNYTGKDFVIINFEGSWDQSLAERKLKASPLIDVASMVWSFYYAVYTGFHQYKTTRPEEIAYLEPYAKQWWLWVSTIFVREYYETVKPYNLIPASRDDIGYLLKFYLLEKLLKEMNYFIRKRPQKLSTPLNALAFLVGQITPEAEEVMQEQTHDAHA
ncbi:MAG: maltose alpha-D-glucosyltransferase [Acidobacteriota bacterium]